jgi:RimJ/RimL family protein N-acetyltransferase
MTEKQRMLNLIIRDARIEDAAILAAAERATAEMPGLLVSRPYELIPENFEKKIVDLSKLGRYVVAEKDGNIIGHALLDPMPLEAISHVFRLTIVVHPGFLGQGIGTSLMRDLMEWSKQSPRVKKIELLVRASNARAIHLYSKLGFIEEGRFRNRVRLPDDELVDDIAMAWFPRREHNQE